VAHDGVNDFKRRVFKLVEEEKQKVEIIETPAKSQRAEDEGYTWMSRASEDQDFGI
jgi:hypothetical protein